MAKNEPLNIEKGAEICPSFVRCGGCTYLGIDYKDQLEIKRTEVLKCLENEGVNTSIFIGIEPSPCMFSYRNKMEYTFGNEVKNGPTILGLHARKSFISIVSADECRLVPEDFNRVVKATLEFVLEKSYTHYNKKSHEGFLRSLIIRRGVRTNELLVNIVTSSQDVFDSENDVKRILSCVADSNVVGILHTINDNRADAVVADDIRVLYGHPYYNEEILGLKFRVGAFSFFQTNVEAAERLYKDAISLINSLEGKTVFDLYCGTGTITQAMALKAKKAIGIEIVEEAVETARASSKLNGLDNCRFIVGDVGKVLDELEELPDVITVDPPRAGILPKALLKILSYGVDQIIYISCNPKTMAANLRTAQLSGYEIIQLKAYDNFTFTKHTECIALLCRK